MPVVASNEKPLAVGASLVKELGPHLESDPKPTDRAPVLVPDREDFLLVDLKSDGDITLLDEVDLSKLVELFIDIRAFVVENWLQIRKHTDHEISVLSIGPSIKLFNASHIYCMVMVTFNRF